MTQNLFANAGEGSKIRVYGIGLKDNNPTQDNDLSWQLKLSQNIEGWPVVPGIETQSYWSKGKLEGGVEVEWTLSAAGAAAVKTNQTVISGPNFTVYYVTIDNSEVVVAPTFTPVNGASEIYSTKTDLTSDGININDVDLTNATEVTVTVQGTESGSSSVSVNGVSATKQSARKRTRSATPVTYTATLTGDNIGTSIRITGSNFTVYHVYANVMKASSAEGEVLLENPPKYQNHIINANKFTNIKSGDEIRIYYSWLQDHYWQIQTWEGLNAGYQYTIEAWGGTSINTRREFINTEKNYIFMRLDANLITMLQARGLQMNFDGIDVTVVTLVRK